MIKKGRKESKQSLRNNGEKNKVYQLSLEQRVSKYVKGGTSKSIQKGPSSNSRKFECKVFRLTPSPSVPTDSSLTRGTTTPISRRSRGIRVTDRTIYERRRFTLIFLEPLVDQLEGEMDGGLKNRILYRNIKKSRR